jgi:hypothetical protein
MMSDDAWCARGELTGWQRRADWAASGASHHHMGGVVVVRAAHSRLLSSDSWCGGSVVMRE